MHHLQHEQPPEPGWEGKKEALSQIKNSYLLFSIFFSSLCIFLLFFLSDRSNITWRHAMICNNWGKHWLLSSNINPSCKIKCPSQITTRSLAKTDFPLWQSSSKSNTVSALNSVYFYVPSLTSGGTSGMQFHFQCWCQVFLCWIGNWPIIKSWP